jgi:hypothetical protein
MNAITNPRSSADVASRGVGSNVSQRATGRRSKTASVRTRIDVDAASPDDQVFLEYINANLFGQPAAKQMLLRIHRAAKNPFRDRTRPIYKALMPGDSHTGKTETACVLASYYHDDPEAFIRVNCANYKNNGDISRLLGTGPGWIGYTKPPTDEERKANANKFDPSALLASQNLTASRKGSKSPYTIILLDEFEKAGDEFEQFLLAIFSSAKERMGNNDEVDFSDCIFLMPCNLGMGEISQKQKGGIGFVQEKVDTKSELDDIILRRYPIEVINRFDEVCIYGKLTRDDINSVLGLHINKVQQRVNKAYGTSSFTITVEESARQVLLGLCLNDRGDVADLKRVVPRRLTDPVSVAVETGTIGAGDELVVCSDDGVNIEFYRVGDGPVRKLDGSKLPNAGASEGEQEDPMDSSTWVNKLARSMTVEANRHLTDGNNRFAQNVLEDAIDSLRQEPDPVCEVQVLNMLGLAFFNSKVYDQAARHFASALNVRLELNDNENAVRTSMIYGNLALALIRDGQRAKARSILEQGLRAIRINRRSESSEGLKHFFEVYTDLEPSKTKALLEYCITLGDRS